MAQAVFDEWKEEYRAEGEARGEARGRAEGEARGRAEGEARGEARGHARGLIEGEEKKALEIARNLLRANSHPELVVAATGLSPEKVRELTATLRKD